MSRSIYNHLDETVIAALREPILNNARGLPASVYTDPEFFELEQQELFPKVWVSVAFATDVANPGDAVPLSLNGLPIILVRSADNTIRAFHNVCRHRATILLEEPCQGLRHFNCPYHGWSYALDGKLKATPFWDGTADSHKMPVDPATNSLVPIRCAVWNQVVYINIDGQAEPLDEYLAPLARQLANLDLSALELGHRVHWEFNANWKLVMENWEVYHHVWVHDGVFDKMSDEVDFHDGEPYTDMIADENILLLLANERRPPRDLTGPASELPGLPQLGPAQELTGAANAVLPNTTLTTGPVAYAPAIYIPLAADRTRVEMAWYFAPGVGSGETHTAGREAVLERWLGPTRHLTTRQGIRAQDHRCMELQQAARQSPVANDVKFSTTWEANVRYFQDWLITRLGA